MPVNADATTPTPSEAARPALRRLRLDIQYDGAAFHGWQSQANAVNVQDAVEEALARVLGHPARLYSAGRTDTGVHAAALPVHFDTPLPIPAGAVPVAVNKFLPPGVRLLTASEVAPDWDARFSARLRWYRYQVVLAPTDRPLGPRAWTIYKGLDAGKLERGLSHLRGEHDFRGFRSAQCQSQRTRLLMLQARLTQTEWAGAPLLALDFKCRSFLHHMVRFMVGSVVAHARGRLSEAGLLAIRDQFDRPLLSTCAPARGLCLMAVGYDDAECAALLEANPAAPSF